MEQLFTFNEVANFIEEFEMGDGPCFAWFNEQYCNNCLSVEKDGHEYAYCELHDECRHFSHYLTVREIIELWLENYCKEREEEND